MGITAQAQTPFTPTAAFTSLTTNDGLSSNCIRALQQDSKGFIWMGTSNGIDRYDGHNIMQMTKKIDIGINCMDIDGDSIWVGTNNGLYIYNIKNDSLRMLNLHTANENLNSINIADLKTDKTGHLWIATMANGIIRIDTKSGHTETVKTPNEEKIYGCVYVTRNGQVWASSNWLKENLVHYNAQKNTFEPYHIRFDVQQKMKLNCIAMTEDSNGKMWLALWDGDLLCFDPASHKVLCMYTQAQTQIKNAHSIIEYEPGSIFVGSDKGITSVNYIDGTIKMYTRNSDSRTSLSNNFIYPMMKDREGGTWIGTYYGGVNYTHPASANFATCMNSVYKNSVSGNVINSFCQDSHGRLWISSDDGGLCYYTPETGLFTKMSIQTDGIEHNTQSLCIVGEDMYVGTYSSGLDIVNTNTLQVTKIPVFIDDNGKYIDRTSYSIYKDHKNNIWVGAFRCINKYNPATRTFKKMKNLGVPVVDMLQDFTEKLWVATNGNGLWMYNTKGEWKQYLYFETEKNKKEAVFDINSIHEDEESNLWIGTTAGLFKYNRNEDTFVNIKIYDNVNVHGITTIGKRMWMSTSKGIICYSLSLDKIIKVYRTGGNIISTDFMSGAIYSKNGRVWMGTTEGFITFAPEKMRANDVKPKVEFTDIDVLNRHVEVGSDILPKALPYMDAIKLSYKENVFSIWFSAMSYMNPSDISYSYYLEGFDSKWVEVTNNKVTYTNLSPGTYVLHVKAITNDGMQSDESTLRIIITHPFYWNAISQTIYVIIILLALFLTMRHLLHKNEKRHEAEIEEINVKKDQEIQEVHEQKEQEIHEINKQKEDEIKEISNRMEQEVHDARIKMLTITDKEQEFLDNIEKIIENNFSNPEFAVDDLASELGVSRSGLFSKIKVLADVTPNEMIQIIRLRHAASLLQTNNYRVNEVCYMVGFSSPSYFAKCFQKQYGCTPAKFKDKN